MILTTLPQPVEQAYSGGDTIAVRRLQEFCYGVNSNFNTITAEIAQLKLRNTENININRTLIQFMNWLAVTNPQILDEFQTTSNAFERLSPRASQDEGASVTQPPA